MKGIIAFAGAGGVVALLALALIDLSYPAPAQATHIDGAGHVFVNNPPGQAVPIRDVSGREPFTVYLSANWVSGQPLSGRSFTVPSGKRLVIEYVSFRGLVSDGFVQEVELVTPSTPSNGHHFFELTTRGNGASFYAAQPMRAYASAGTSTLTFHRNVYGGSGDYWKATVVGYLIPTT